MSSPTISAGRKRLPKGADIQEWTARVTTDAYLYLTRLCLESGCEMSVALDRVLKEHRKMFHTEQ